MILRPIQPRASATPSIPLAIWTAIERSQKELAGANECWLITQPAHSAVSGDIAAKLSKKAFGKLDAATVRAIALHDAGWSSYDAEMVSFSRFAGSAPRKGKSGCITSFVAVPAQNTFQAWTDSVEVALKVGALGGHLVSEHFRGIALSHREVVPDALHWMDKFIAQEDSRQRKIRPTLTQTDDELKSLVEAIRFCDLLSLYLCCGAEDDVQFSQVLEGKNIVLQRRGNSCTLSPFPFEREEIFQVQALRHPKTKNVSSAAFHLKMERPG